MVKKAEPVVPVDISGTPLVKLTAKQYAKAKELEYERLTKSGNKGVYLSWTREEKQILVTWAQDSNFDLSLSEFKDIVDGYIKYHTEPLILRSLPKIDKTGRELDVLCNYCARVHTFTVPVGFRGEWTVDSPCTENRKPESGQIKINDNTPIAKWETKWLGV